MKKLTLISLILTGISFGGQAFAQATASATIITPISISKNTDMSFGNIATNGTIGQVVLAADGSRSYSGGVTLPCYHHGHGYSRFI